MRSDRRGEAGFMEAMVAFMAVTVVLAAYLGMLASVAVEDADPTRSLEEDRFTGFIDGGVFTPAYVDYLRDFLDISGCGGVSVSVTVPGGLCGPVEPLTLGSMDGSLHTRQIISTVGDDAGRELPAVFEVTVCA